MTRLEEFQALTLEWQTAKQNTAIAQLNFDLKMNGFLTGLGDPPPLEDQMAIDSLRFTESEKRVALDIFIYEYIEEFPRVSEEGEAFPRDILSLLH